MTLATRRQALEDALDLIELEVNRCWHWVESLPPGPAQTLAAKMLARRYRQAMCVEDLWLIVSVAVMDKNLPRPQV